LIEYAPEASAQIDELIEHYTGRGRVDALIRLTNTLIAAERRIQTAPFAGISAPRPYPELSRFGLLWIHEWRFWIAYRALPTRVIRNVFYDNTDIPGYHS
jgi:hypothetical protein